MSRILPLAAGLILLIMVAAWFEAARLLSQAPMPPVPAEPSFEAATNLTLLDEPKPVPELHFANGQGGAVSLTDFRGKVLLLNIWATWCFPCRKEMPTLERLQEKIGGKDFEVIVLSIDQEGAAAVERFYKEIGIRRLGIHVDASGKVADDLSVVGLPTTLLIDREGLERARLIGPAIWDSPNIMGVIKSVVAAPRPTRSGLNWSPRRSTTELRSPDLAYLSHANLKLSVKGVALTFQ
jgi:thiol-disulfide isomerase/thioredoxin